MAFLKESLQCTKIMIIPAQPKKLEDITVMKWFIISHYHKLYTYIYHIYIYI